MTEIEDLNLPTQAKIGLEWATGRRFAGGAPAAHFRRKGTFTPKLSNMFGTQAKGLDLIEA
jgi:hypothetical protein